MKKIEIIWREILYQALERNNYIFNQSKLAEKFGISTSTVHAALNELRRLGIVEVKKKFFRLKDYEKLLFFWATKRNLEKDICYATRVDLPVMETEGSLPAQIIPTAYTAFRFLFKEAPADYDQIYVYSQEDISGISKRFPPQKGNANLFILREDKWLKKYRVLPLGQLFVDLWNLPQWYARDFYQNLLDKIRK
ncbi:winged helix-turn-helix transcriptional regulator [Candidatus Gottesmanbacteria bacterium]|nr:winged helix-turn-helix transcriptional regulator [Candidatus Gottesmanbacteria bacterium]